MSNYDDLSSEAYYQDETDFIHDDLLHAQDHFQEVLNILYNKETSIENLETHLDEVCAALQVNPKKDRRLQIQRKENPYFDHAINLVKQVFNS